MANPHRVAKQLSRTPAHSMTDPDWNTFDPGFDHGQVELRPANIDGVFSASKISVAAAGLV